MKKIVLLMALSVFLGGCAYARVWHKTDSDRPTMKEEVQVALSECEKTDEVASWHSKASTWRYLCIGFLWFPFVNIGMCFASDAVASKYESNLIKCMEKTNFTPVPHRTGRMGWDALSDFNISMEEWEKQRSEDSPESSSKKE
jgi:hypothetical protein